MAGAGYKLFNTGDVLTAAQVNTYLQEQVVMVFANATARTTALSGVLAEGMISYLKDTDALEMYNGSAWVSASGTGDITAVTTGANSGLTGGATSGAADLKINFASKGQLAVGTGSGTTDFLNAGTNNYVLVADSTQTTGLKWAAQAAGGKVLQVVSATTTTSTSISTTSFADTNLTATITPTSATSKVLVLISQHFYWARSGSEATVKYQVLRGATQIYDLDSSSMFAYYDSAATSQEGRGGIGISYLDSPATTSATTYKSQAKIATSTTANFNNGATSSIVLLEIGA